jgi:hypothetical protein
MATGRDGSRPGLGMGDPPEAIRNHRKAKVAVPGGPGAAAPGGSCGARRGNRRASQGGRWEIGGPLATNDVTGAQRYTGNIALVCELEPFPHPLALAALPFYLLFPDRFRKRTPGGPARPSEKDTWGACAPFGKGHLGGLRALRKRTPGGPARPSGKDTRGPARSHPRFSAIQ